MSGTGTKRSRLLVLCALSALLFGTLGVWQVGRISWKVDLISRVNARISAPPVPVPPKSQWATLDPDAIAYRRVTAEGVFDHRRETSVDALTERGSGDWLITPLKTRDGLILVNRGFVPEGRLVEAARPAGQVRIAGLLRASEPGGRFLRANRPSENRWYSRDVAAIAETRKIGPVAPFFIDADKGADALPVGGLTVVRFRNAHLAYALTWFALAGLALAGLVLVMKLPSPMLRGERESM